MAKQKKIKKVKERLPVAPATKVIPNPKKEADKNKCREKVKPEKE